MKYKIGQKVTIVTLDWLKKNTIGGGGHFQHKQVQFHFEMLRYCGKEMTIKNFDNEFYTMEEDQLPNESHFKNWSWYPWTIDETITIIRAEIRNETL